MYRELTWQDADRATSETLDVCGVLVFIIAAAVPFGWAIAVTKLPPSSPAWCCRSPTTRVLILAMINVLLLIVGCFMETTAILLIATPTLLPLILQLGIDPVQFGIIIVVNLLIGAMTPPFGVILFIMKDIARVSFGAYLRAVLPFYMPLAVRCCSVTYWPDFVLSVPRLFKG